MRHVAPPILKGYDITKEEYIEINRTGGIVRLGLHVSCPACNLSCPYCLNGSGSHYVENNQTDNVDADEQKSWIRQAYELGARCFVIDGIYEPLANEAETLELLDYIRCLGVTPILITNMTYMDERIVKHLAELYVSVLGNDTNLYRYCGEYFDNETGNIYLNSSYILESILTFFYKNKEIATEFFKGAF